MDDQNRPADLDVLRIKRPEETPGYMQAPRRRRAVFWGGLLGAAAALVLILYLTGVLPPAREVTVATVSRFYPSQAFTVLNASGYVVAQRKASVSSKGTGRLEFLGVEEGNRVKKGEVIASLENADLEAARNRAAANLQVAAASLTEAQAELADAALNYRRQKKLVAADLVAKQDFDTAEARYKKAQAAVAAAQANIGVARAALNEAQTTLEYTLIRAPFNGVILTKNAEVGEVVAPFGSATNARAAVVTMADMDSLMVEADVAEANISQVKSGQPCEIQLDALPGVRFAGRVHMIVPTADRAKATILTKVAFLEADDRILPEMSAKVAFLSRAVAPGEETPRLVVAPPALVQRQGVWEAFVVTRDDRVAVTPVEVGEKLGDFVEIKGGLREGDRVVLNPPKKLRDGDKIRIREG